MPTSDPSIPAGAGQGPGDSDRTLDEAKKVPLETSVRQSWLYRIRLPFTAVCLLSGVGVTLLSPPMVSPRSTLGLMLAAGGVILVLIGIALRLWALASISERKTRQLVTTGAYSLCRNPLYIGTLLIGAGFVVLWQGPLLCASLVPVILLYQFGVVPLEERVLFGLFGDEFTAYCRSTPRWWPRLGAYVPEDRLAIRSVGVRNEAQSGLWWIALAALTLWITFMRSPIS